MFYIQYSIRTMCVIFRLLSIQKDLISSEEDKVTMNGMLTIIIIFFTIIVRITEQVQ